MLLNSEKASLVFDLHGNKSSALCQNLVKLLNILIAEIRVDNDTATGGEVPRNQGKIAAYQGLYEYIERGLPMPNRPV